MFKLVFILSVFFSINCFSQTTSKPDQGSAINAEEQVNGLPGSTKAGAYSVRKKKPVQIPTSFAPAENLSPAACADSLGQTGGANFTACEANKKSR